MQRSFWRLNFESEMCFIAMFEELCIWSQERRAAVWGKGLRSYYPSNYGLPKLKLIKIELKFPTN